MLDIDSALFLKLVREKALPHPTSRRFETDRWVAAAKALKAPSERDRQLLVAALHYGDAAFPRAHNLTCRNLQRAWCVIRDCARILVTRAKERKFDSIDAIEAMALLIRRVEIERALTHCLAVTTSDAAAIVDFLICDLSDLTSLFTKSFWAVPLLPISGSDDLAIVFPALSVGSAVRRVESWLERGGLSDHLSDARRGIKYEAWVRIELASAISGNALLTGSLCAPNAVPRSGGNGEQIDLIIVLGDMLIVGEVKCFLYPIESSEHYDYLRKLNEAGEQAVRKGKWLTQNPDEIVKAVGISAERAGTLRAIPIVVTNQGAGFGLDASGARVIDFHFLRLYFSDNEYVAGMAVKFSERQAVNQAEVLYGSEAEAADNFEKTMANPPPLKRYIRAAEWKENRFPLSSGESMVVENCVVGDSIADDANRLATVL
jgi:hypothetical protein